MLIPTATFISQGTAHAAACGAGGTGGVGGLGGAGIFGGNGGVGGVGGAGAACDQNGEDGLFDTSDFNAPQTQQAIDGDVVNVFTDNEFRSVHDVDLSEGGDLGICGDGDAGSGDAGVICV